MLDRFGPLPEEVERLLDAQALRLLGTRLGIERVYVKGREGRVTFRASANPRLSALEVPFRDRQVEIQVSRMAPLSLTLRQVGAEPLTRTLVRALEAVVAEPARAA
jgi:transcription-repair coupling factor (superfamily II helicase)